MASSASGQDELNPALSCPAGTSRRDPQEKFPWKPYNNFFIDQACSVKMAGYWPSSFFIRGFFLRDRVEVHKHAKKNEANPAILTEQAWSITHIYYSFNIFPRFWLVKTTRIIHHYQLLLTKFAKNFGIFNRWHQKCSPLQIIEPLPKKTWGRGSLVPSRPRRFRMWRHLSSLSGKFAWDAWQIMANPKWLTYQGSWGKKRTTLRCCPLKRSTDARKRCIKLIRPKYSMIVAENRGFRREIIWDFFSLIWGFFAIFCQASRYRARFQASSGHSDIANRRGYEAGDEVVLFNKERNGCG